SLSEAEAPPWGTALEALDELRRARAEAEREATLAELERILRTGADAARAHERTWRDLLETIALKAKVAAAENRRAHDLLLFISAEQALLIFRAYQEALREVISDRELLRQVHARTYALLSAETKRPDAHGDVPQPK